MSRRLYWLGNIAKTVAIDEILKARDSSRQTVVFDYGCGDGGDWPRILKDYQDLVLVAYEPGERSFRAAQRRLQGVNARLLSGPDIHSLNIRADFIVSFSVFEHVYDRLQFLRLAKHILAPQGLFYLNYDDGHFRNCLDLTRPSTWLGAVREWVHSAMSPALAAIGRAGRYQRRVEVDEAERLLAQAGFRTERVAYHNLTCLKLLYKTLSEEQQERFSSQWMEFELMLNRDYRKTLDVQLYGDRTNLWHSMGSRTMYLRHT